MQESNAKPIIKILPIYVSKILAITAEGVPKLQFIPGTSAYVPEPDIQAIDVKTVSRVVFKFSSAEFTYPVPIFEFLV